MDKLVVHLHVYAVRMPRSVLAGLMAIVAMSLGSLAYVYAVTSPPSGAGAASPEVVEAPPETVAAPPAETGATPAPPAAPRGAPLDRTEPEDRVPPAEPSPSPASAPAHGERALRDAVARAGLESLSSELVSGLSDLRAQVALCGGGPGEAGDTAAGGLSAAEFVLSLRTGEGAVRVVEAHVLASGEASEAQLTCARSMLAGQVILAPGARPGAEWELPFGLR